MLGHEAVLLATVISEPDLQKRVINSVVLAKPIFICVCVCVYVCVRVCVRTDLYMHKLLKRQRQIASPSGASWGQRW